MKHSRNVSNDGRNFGSHVFKVEGTTLKETWPNSFKGRRKICINKAREFTGEASYIAILGTKFYPE
jgi:hypothetical protein